MMTESRFEIKSSRRHAAPTPGADRRQASFLRHLQAGEGRRAGGARAGSCPQCVEVADFAGAHGDTGGKGRRRGLDRVDKTVAPAHGNARMP